MLIDISPLISERIGVWPGDTPFSRENLAQMSKGDNYDLSTIRATLHLGAHADAPAHYRRGGQSIADCALDPYYGACSVVEVKLARGERIQPEHLPADFWSSNPGEAAQRVLFKTGSFPDSDRFNTDFNSLSPKLIERLSARGCKLVGIDTPSVDPFDDRKLESHQALFRFQIRNLEGLSLNHVTPGRYTLIALPLKIEGADASPVRAVLLS